MRHNAVRRAGRSVALGGLACGLLWLAPQLRAQVQTPISGQAAFRELYKELVEINTTLSAGSCTAAAEAMATRLKAAGLPAIDMQMFAPPDRPKDGASIATLRVPERRANTIPRDAH